jgi:small subunit ribosomal protein S5
MITNFDKLYKKQEKNSNSYVKSLKFKNFIEKIIQIKRVTKVVKGGKILNFRVLIVVGNNKNQIGLGIGKAENVNLAIEKAILNGKKNIITIPITKNYSIPNICFFNFGACKIMLCPAKVGTGIIAGSSIKPVLELAGIKNILAKRYGSKNLLNNAKSTFFALKEIKNKIILNNKRSYYLKFLYKKILNDTNL